MHIYEMLKANKRYLYVILLICINIINECDGHHVMSITREFHGDAYTLKGNDDSNRKVSITSNNNSCECISGSFLIDTSSAECRCQCHNTSSIFRDDSLTCVNNLNECPLISSKILGSIPHFHLNQETQFISPTDEIPNLDVNKTEERKVLPFCIIAKGQYLTTEGWKDMEGSSFDVPLQLISGSGEIAFEWVGNSSSKEWLKGRLVLIHLLCKNAATSSPTSFKQCVTFRVQGTLNMRKAIFSLLNDEVEGQNSMTKGVIIGIGLLLGSLSLCYILVSYFYFKTRKNKKKINPPESLNEVEKGKVPQKPSITASQNDTNMEIIINKPTFHFPMVVPLDEDKNPDHNKNRNLLMRANVQQDDSPEEEIYSTPSPEEEIEGRRQRFERLQRELGVTLSKECNNDFDDYVSYEATPSSLGLAIVETSGSSEDVSLSSDEIPKSEGKNIFGMKNRKRLFFNPSYFDPEMLQSPPPGALEFLSSVREMMSLAKQKIQMKSFHPTLIDIPEGINNELIYEETTYSNLVKNVQEKNRSEREKDKNEREKNGSEREKYKKEREKNGKEWEKGRKEGEIILDENEDKTKETANTRDRKESNKNCFSHEEEKEVYDILTTDHVAKRKNANEQNVVNEIIQSLELKSRLPDPNCIVKPKSVSLSTPEKDLSTIKTKVSDIISKENSEHNNFSRPQPKTSYIKRNWSLKENKQNLKSSVENIKQEIQIKLNRVSSLSRIQSLKRSKRETTNENLPNPDLYSETRKNKVSRWLNSLENHSNFTDVELMANPLIECDKASLNEKNLSLDQETNSLKSSITTMRSKSLNNFESESYSLSFGYSSSSNDEAFPCQQDNEVSTIDINTHFYEKDSFPNSHTHSQSYKLPSTILDGVRNISFIGKPFPTNMNCLLAQDSVEDTERERGLERTTELLRYNRNNISARKFTAEEDSYEEIQFKSDSLKSDAELTRGIESRSYKYDIKYEKPSDEKIKISLFHNPDPVTSEICVPANNLGVKQPSNNFLCIELSDDSCKENEKFQSSCKGESKGRYQVKRNDSIVQDSLERPKIKRRLNYEERKEVLPFREKDSSVLNEGTNVRALISNIYSYELDKPSTVRRSKTMKTFKDYKRIKFSNPKAVDSKLTFFGEGINLNYSTGRSSTANESFNKPSAIPVKQIKSSPEIPNSLEGLFHGYHHITSDSVTTKRRIRYSNSFSPLDLSRRPKQLLHIYSDSHDISQMNNPHNAKVINKNFEKQFPTDVQSNINVYDPIEINQISTESWPQNKGIYTDEGNLKRSPEKVINLAFANPDHLHNLQITGKNSLLRDHVDSKSLNVLPTPLVNCNLTNKSNGKVILTPKYSGTSLTNKSSFYTKEGLCDGIKELKTEKCFDEAPKVTDLTFRVKVKDEMESYLNHKTDVINVNHNWRNLLNKIDTSREEQFLAKEINSLHNIKCNHNNSFLNNGESNDKNISPKHQHVSNTKQLKPNLKKSNSVSRQNSFKQKTSNFIHRSVSLHRMAQENLGKKNKLSLAFDKKVNSPKFSVYINDSFSIDDE